MSTKKTSAQEWEEQKLALYGPDTPMDKLENSLAGLHVYHCGSGGARGSLTKDYGLTPIPHKDIYAVIKVPDGLSKEERAAYCKAEEKRRGHTEQTFKEYCSACDEHADAESDHMMDASAEMAQRVLDVYRGSECGYCGRKHTDPSQEYSHNYDFALMALFEAVADEIVERSATHEHSIFSKDDLAKCVAGITKGGA